MHAAMILPSRQTDAMVRMRLDGQRLANAGENIFAFAHGQGSSRLSTMTSDS